MRTNGDSVQWAMLQAVRPASSVRLLASTHEACCSSAFNLPGPQTICGRLQQLGGLMVLQAASSAKLAPKWQDT